MRKEVDWRFTAAASMGNRMTALLILESVADTKGRWNEQVARSKAECHIANDEHDDCLNKQTNNYGTK